MHNRRTRTLLPTASLAAVCAALGVAWVVEPSFAPEGITGRLTVLLCASLLILVAVRIAFLQAAKTAQAARVHIDYLCSLEPTELLQTEHQDDVPLRKEDRFWRGVCEQVRERLAAFAQRADQLEMARAAAEVRCRRVAAEREQLHEILAGLADPIVAVNQFGDVVLANTSAERLLGAVSDGNQPAILPIAYREQLTQLLNEARRRRMVTHKSTELIVTDEEGRERWYRVMSRALGGAGDQSAAGEKAPGHGAVAVLTDITGLKAIQKRNAEFVSSVSHEMKTPLASIRAYVELLADGEAEDEATREEFLEVINSQADRLQRLIDNMLNLARIEAGVVAVNKAALSLNELLAEAVEVLQPAARDKQITLVSEPSELYLGVLADRDMLLQAAINLLSNAVKYTKPGGTVTLRSRLNDQEVAFEVQDTGVGLSPEDCQKVFEKFYRVKKDREMAQGTGLGLSLVKHIVEDVHGGHIEVASELGRGSTFRVVLPAMMQIKA
jgi:two-component system phosphate regulon sensor histidine kinase PhoR